MLTNKLRLTLISGALVALLAFGATAAQAHVALVKSNPTSGAKLSSAPKSVWLLFSGPIRSGTLKVTGPGNKVVSSGRGGRDPRNVDRLLVGLKRGLKKGSYKASGSSIAADGHHQTWTLSFSLK